MQQPINSDDVNGIIQRFLGKWKGESKYLGAVLTGSRATGTATEYSDIDLLLVLKEGVNYRERGNEVIGGIVLEYVAYPSDYWKQLFEEEVKKSQRMWLRMWKVAKIIDDRSNKVKSLLDDALSGFDSPIDKLEGKNLEMAKYQLWDGLENIKDLSKSDDIGFMPAYYLQLSKIVGSYSQFLGIVLPAVAKWGKYFKDGRYRDVYSFKELPDKKFVGLALEAMSIPKIDNVEVLTNYVLEKLGGFQIDGWKLIEL